MKDNKEIRLPAAELPALPVWLSGGGEDDEYADFFPDVEFDPAARYTLRIAADTDYNVFLDGKLIGFGQYSDYPGRLVYDEYSFSANAGSVLVVRAWHSGVNSLTHVMHRPYAVFALFRDGVPVPGGCSSERTLSAPSPGYVPHRKTIITSQTGAGFTLDLSRPADERTASAVTDTVFSAVVPRPNRRLQALPEVEGKLVKSGRYRPAGGKNAAERMKNAAFGEGEGYYYIYDLGRETVGFPVVGIDAPQAGTLACGWGEHLTDGRCRTSIGGRAFAFECAFPAGKSRFSPCLRRLGCRYLQIFTETELREVSLSFIPVIYPVEEKETALEGQRRVIYDTAVHTLRCCMHEHYEDCPWREQALYTLDSRNQMLAGYAAFEDGNREMVRASLDLISRGVRKDGILSLCFPGGLDFPIPFYTLAYFIQFREYLDFSGDVAFAAEKYPVLTSLMNSVLSRMIADGRYRNLCPRYPDSAGYWNFYEWSPSMSGSKYAYDESDPPCEAPFNAALVLALRSLSEIASAIGDSDKAEEYLCVSKSVQNAVRRVFRREDGLFSSFTDRKDAPVSVLTQALCLLCGAADGLDRSAALRLIEDNGGGGSIPATLSMACFRYDAMLLENAGKYSGSIISEIDSDCSAMLSRGSTTFWETIRGEEDFSGAGSLCHGWSAMAAYYYRRLLQ